MTAPSAVQSMDTSSDAPAAAEKKRQMPETKKWKILYPAFIDARKTAADGRRIPKARAVEGPTAQEVAEACARLGLPTVLEPKAYSRDFTQFGRIRVCLKSADGTLVVADIPNRRALMFRVSALIPTLPSRNAAAKQDAGKKKKKGGK